MDTEQKLNILADGSKFDLACACKYKDEPGRQRGAEGRWIYPASLPDGRKVFLLKTLQSNACVNDCSYCPFNRQRDLERCTLAPENLADTFMDLLAANRVNGLFLSSGIVGTADASMERMLGTVELLRRKHQFRGFVHLKILPGASDNAIEQAVRLATRVSINIEAPSAERLAKLSGRKRFHEDIIATMRKINNFRREHGKKGKQSTQFVVGAAGESDREIVLATERLYQGYQMGRVYYSAFQTPAHTKPAPRIPNLFEDDLPLPDGKQKSWARRPSHEQEIFLREHRLYQVDFLFRGYGFKKDDIYFDEQGNLSLQADPKTLWAQRHPEFFPVNLNRAEKWQLLRVPGLGPIGVRRILAARRVQRIAPSTRLHDLGVRSPKLGEYICF